MSLRLCIHCRYCQPYAQGAGVGYHCLAIFRSLVDGTTVVFDASVYPQLFRSLVDGTTGSAWEAWHTCPVYADDIQDVSCERCASCDKPVCEQCSKEWLKQCQHCGEYFCLECVDRWDVEPILCMECAKKADEEALR